MRKVARASVALAAFVLAACGSSSPPTAPSPSPPTGTAAAYLSRVLDTMQANSINRYQIDWIAFRQTVTRSAPNPTAISDTHPAISTALGLLDDHHSIFVRPDGSHISNPNRLPCSDPEVATPSVPPDIGYVRVGSTSGSVFTPLDFAVDIQRRIAAADKSGLSGWIVDLRGNGGGTMWPMVAGLGPIIGEGTLGAFVDPDNQVTFWTYANGASILAGATQIQVPSPYALVTRAPQVAVLTDCRVASAGEATAIAFRGRPNTRFFGGPTLGISTGLRVFPMTDGATLNLAVSTMSDRNVTRYGVPLVPDEIVGDPSATVARAIEWLRSF